MGDRRLNCVRCGEGSRPAHKIFFLPCPFAPFVPCRLWTVLHLQISLKFYGFPWLVVCDSHGFHKGSKIQHKPSIANLSLNYLESHNGSGKNERTTAAQPRAKRRVFSRSTIRCSLKDPVSFADVHCKFLQSSKLVKGTSSLICFVRPNARAPFH